MDILKLKIGDQVITIARTPASKLTNFRARLSQGDLWDGVLVDIFANAVTAGAERYKERSVHKGEVSQNLDGSNYEQVLAEFCRFNGIPMPGANT